MKLFGQWVGREGSRPALSTSGSRAGTVATGEWPPSYETAVREGYPLRGGDPHAVMAALDWGLTRVEDQRAGDVLLMRTGPGQLHLGVWTDAGLVHADASLRRVVMRPGAVAWPVLGRWRWEGE